MLLLLLLIIAAAEKVRDLLLQIHTQHTAVSKSDMLLLYNMAYMNYPWKINTGGAREGGGFLKHAANF